MSIVVDDNRLKKLSVFLFKKNRKTYTMDIGKQTKSQENNNDQQINN